MTRRFAFLLAGLLLLAAAPAWAQTTSVNDQEVQGFFLPGGGAKAFRVHASRTELGLQLAHGPIIAVRGYKNMIQFSHGARVGVGATNSAAVLAGSSNIVGIGSPATFGSGVTNQVMAQTGSIIGICVQGSTAVTAGSITVEATLRNQSNATQATGLTATLGTVAAPSTTWACSTAARGTYAFQFLEGVGAQTTTSATLAPATIDLAITVIVET